MPDDWSDYHDEQRARRAKRLPIRSADILALERAGYAVEQKTQYHFRINGIIDLYPTHNRWYDLRTHTRGGAQDLAVWLMSYLDPHTGTHPTQEQ